MLYLPELRANYQIRTMTEVFGGYNHNLKISEGEWYHEKNLSARAYPLFAERESAGCIIRAWVKSRESSPRTPLRGWREASSGTTAIR